MNISQRAPICFFWEQFLDFNFHVFRRLVSNPTPSSFGGGGLNPLPPFTCQPPPPQDTAGLDTISLTKPSNTTAGSLLLSPLDNAGVDQCLVPQLSAAPAEEWHI